MTRKRRSNRLTVEQLEANRDLRERELNQPTVMIGFGQEHLPWHESLYRSISLREALQLVRSGDAEKFVVDTANGACVIFRELKPIMGVQYCLPMMPNAATAEALVGISSGARAAKRIANLLLFPFEGDRKAPLTGPRVTDRDRKRASSMLGFRPERPDTRVWRDTVPAAA